jgi:hypothetical protein
MSGEKHNKVHWRGSEELESRFGSQTMGLLPMVAVYMSFYNYP